MVLVRLLNAQVKVGTDIQFNLQITDSGVGISPATEVTGWLQTVSGETLGFPIDFEYSGPTGWKGRMGADYFQDIVLLDPEDPDAGLIHPLRNKARLASLVVHVGGEYGATREQGLRIIN